MKYLYILFLLTIILFIFPYGNDVRIDNFTSKTINVTVSGEVEKPGNYQLEAYSKLSDLIELCNLGKKADLSSLNINMVLKNNDYIVIPKISNVVKISINFADETQLTTLPSIGTAKAKSIIDYRNENGLFQKIEDIKNVKGIGEKLFEKIKDLICL